MEPNPRTILRSLNRRDYPVAKEQLKQLIEKLQQLKQTDPYKYNSFCKKLVDNLLEENKRMSDPVESGGTP